MKLRRILNKEGVCEAGRMYNGPTTDIPVRRTLPTDQQSNMLNYLSFYHLSSKYITAFRLEQKEFQAYR